MYVSIFFYSFVDARVFSLPLSLSFFYISVENTTTRRRRAFFFFDIYQKQENSRLFYQDGNELSSSFSSSSSFCFYRSLRILSTTLEKHTPCSSALKSGDLLLKIITTAEREQQ
jgi:hypothetical protein